MKTQTCVLATLVASFAFGQDPSTASLLRGVQFRSVGPAVTGGRVIDIECHPAQPMTIYVASASGGLWKSVNNGNTFAPIFDNQGTISIGDVAIAPSDPKTIWVGTGEHNNQRSCHFGDGVYKSTDAGATWQNMGLRESIHIGRIAIDHKNPDTVYVASVGPLYRGGGERGVYKTEDGGKTWSLVLKGDNETTGFIELQMDPKDNQVLYAAAYDRLRRAWNIRDFGPGTGIYKSTDAGKSWKKLTSGLPGGDRLGRIGISVFQDNPKTVYTVIEDLTQGGAGNSVYKTTDAGATWAKVSTVRVQASYYYSQIRVDPHNPDRVWVLGVPLTRSSDGGKTYQSVAQAVHVDHHALWLDPNISGRVLLGNDGGFYISYDDGANWDFVNNLPICQLYAVGADNATPYNVMGGLQDNGVWWGPSRTRVPSGIHNTDWKALIGGDGMYTVPDPNDWSTVYTASQFGALVRVDLKNRQSRSIRPREQGSRWNWLTPILVSPHNERIVYVGSQRVHRSLDRGETWQTISPDLTTNDAEKLRGNVPHCTITKIDESPVQAGVVWAGTDDGNVWMTRDGGVNWSQVNQNIPGAPEKWWISRVVASHHSVGTAYVCITGYREDDFRPFVYKTTDFGSTWTSISSGLPNEPVAVIREDRRNRNLLVVGTELGCHISIDGGATWSRLKSGLPTVAVQDLVIQEATGDLVLGTHGRGIFIANIEPLRQLVSGVTDKEAHLFRPAPALAYSFIPNMFDAFNGNRRYTAANPPIGATINYYLKAAATQVTIELIDVLGNVVRTLEGTAEAGVNTVTWDLRAGGGQPGGAGGGPGGGGGGGGQGGPGGGGQGRGAILPAGDYQVRLKVAGAAVGTALLRVNDWIR